MTTEAVDEVDWRGDGGRAHRLERDGCRSAADVVAAIREDAERIKRRQVEEALGKLDARGEASGARRDVVEGLADSLVDRLLAAPTASIAEAGDGPTLEAAVRLFEIDGEGEVVRNETRRDDVTRPEAER